ncbi:hypothetical protein SLEP1_g57342 [Rubroshorea leprosula]|uniref:Uncharacterized protein n=1 Tax=Rubroshorea leprosula TaxID=152421 RepID=A0AAV5ML30_9ROSI|nr:hypothetical protein SLEP1_g57342 [Rubroshorea leprosula]
MNECADLDLQWYAMHMQGFGVRLVLFHKDATKINISSARLASSLSIFTDFLQGAEVNVATKNWNGEIL